MRRVAVAVVMLLVLPVAVAAYFRVGWSRMEDECLLDTSGQSHESVTYSWSWDPLGFTCSYDDGTSRTSLWL